MRKILFYESRPEWGGAQKCELELVVGLEKLGFQTRFVSSGEGPMVDRLRKLRKKVEIIPISKAVDSVRKEDVKKGLLFPLTQAVQLMPHLWKLIDYINKENITDVYTSQFRSQIIVGWLAKLLGKKVIWHIHGEENLNNILGKIAVTFSDEIIVVSNRLRDNYQNLFPKQRGKFTTVHNGIDLETNNADESVNSKESLSLKQPFKIVTVGTLVQGKRQDLIIEAVAGLVKKGLNFQLNIVGEKPHWHSDEYKNRLLNLVEVYHLEEHVTFSGWVENPIPILRSSDVFVLPSDTEGLPLSIIEAMALGIPVIATDVGGVSELIEDGKTGFLIKPNCRDELIDALQKMRVDTCLRQTMVKNARGKFLQEFTKESFLKGVAGVVTPLTK